MPQVGGLQNFLPDLLAISHRLPHHDDEFNLLEQWPVVCR